MIKNAPEIIYLQTALDPENEEPESFYDLDEVTWCVDNIYDSDIKYIRADLVKHGLK